MTNFPPFVLFSAERADLSDEANRDRTALLGGALSHRGIKWIKADGAYNGKPETSFLVFTHEGTQTADIIEDLAKRYNQESVLYVDAQRLAYLLTLNEPQATIELGKWHEINQYEIAFNASYTVIGGKAYVAGY